VLYEQSNPLNVASEAPVFLFSGFSIFQRFLVIDSSLCRPLADLGVHPWARQGDGRFEGARVLRVTDCGITDSQYMTTKGTKTYCQLSHVGVRYSIGCAEAAGRG
jgi:hypothetical protein